MESAIAFAYAAPSGSSRLAKLNHSHLPKPIPDLFPRPPIISD